MNMVLAQEQYGYSPRTILVWPKNNIDPVSRINFEVENGFTTELLNRDIEY